MKVEFLQLAEVTLKNGFNLDFQIALTQKLQKQLGNLIEQLNIQEEIITIWRLNVKNLGENNTQEDLDF